MAVLGAAVCELPMVRTYTNVMIYGVAMGISGGIITVVFFSVWGQVYGAGISAKSRDARR
jgi:hypothetical protein